MLHQNTAKEFSENFASCVFPDSGPNTLFPNIGERIVKIRMSAMFQQSRDQNFAKLLYKFFKYQARYSKFNNEQYFDIPYVNITRRSLSWTLKLCRTILNERTKVSCSFVQLRRTEGQQLSM